MSPAISARPNGTWLDNDRGAEAQGHRKPSGFPSVLVSLEPQLQWPQGRVGLVKAERWASLTGVTFGLSG